MARRWPSRSALLPCRLLQVGQHLVEVGAHLLDLVVDRAALLRLAAEQREQAAALAAIAPRLRREPVDLGLLAPRGVFVSLDLLGARGIDVAAIEPGKLALEPHAGRIALHAAGARIGLLRVGRGQGRRQRKRGRHKPAPRQSDHCLIHGAEPHPTQIVPAGAIMKRRNGDQSVNGSCPWRGTLPATICPNQWFPTAMHR